MADEQTGGGPGRRFRVEVERAGTKMVLALVGELDLGTIGRVQAELTPIHDGVRHLVLDLRRLEFIDSTGIRVLLELDAASRSDGFDLAIVKGPPAVQNVFELTRLDDRLPLVDSP